MIMREGFLRVGVSVSVWGEERICFVVIIGGGWWTAEDVPGRCRRVQYVVRGVTEFTTYINRTYSQDIWY